MAKETRRKVMQKDASEAHMNYWECLDGKKKEYFPTGVFRSRETIWKQDHVLPGKEKNIFPSLRTVVPSSENFEASWNCHDKSWKKSRKLSCMCVCVSLPWMLKTVKTPRIFPPVAVKLSAKCFVLRRSQNFCNSLSLLLSLWPHFRIKWSG